MKVAKFIITIVFLLGFCFVGDVLAQDIRFELNANTSDVQGQVEGRILRYQADVVGGAGIMFSSDDYFVSNINFSLRDQLLVPELTLGLGLKGIIGRAEFDDRRDYDAYALGFMALGEYDFRKGYRKWPVSIGAGLTFAPSVLSFDETDRYLDLNVSVYGHVHENAAVVVGYRYLDMRFETNTQRAKKADDSIFVGIRLDF